MDLCWSLLNNKKYRNAQLNGPCLSQSNKFYMTSISINLVNIFVHNDKQQNKKKSFNRRYSSESNENIKKAACVFYSQWIRDNFAYTIFMQSICIFIYFWYLSLQAYSEMWNLRDFIYIEKCQQCQTIFYIKW